MKSLPEINAANAEPPAPETIVCQNCGATVTCQHGPDASGFPGPHWVCQNCGNTRFKPAPEHGGYWWCKTCKTLPPPNEVTYEETHDTRYDGCGERVVWVLNEPPEQPSAPDDVLARFDAYREAERQCAAGTAYHDCDFSALPTVSECEAALRQAQERIDWLQKYIEKLQPSPGGRTLAEVTKDYGDALGVIREREAEKIERLKKIERERDSAYSDIALLKRDMPEQAEKIARMKEELKARDDNLDLADAAEAWARDDYEKLQAQLAAQRDVVEAAKELHPWIGRIHKRPFEGRHGDGCDVCVFLDAVDALAERDGPAEK